jgi:hypothetical protein
MIFEKNSNLISQFQIIALIFASAFQQVGVLAQLVEQWTENPCVPGSIPGDTTRNPGNRKIPGFCFLGDLVNRGFGDLLCLSRALILSPRKTRIPGSGTTNTQIPQ